LKSRAVTAMLATRATPAEGVALQEGSHRAEAKAEHGGIPQRQDPEAEVARVEKATRTAKRPDFISSGVVKIAVAALIWGSMGVLIRLAGLAPVVTVFWRSIFATSAIGLLLLVTREARRIVVHRHRVLLPLTGILLLLSMLAFARAVQLTTIANAILVVYTAPVLIALLAPVTLGERFKRSTVLALALAIAGIVLIVVPQGLGVGTRHLVGIGFAGVAAVAYASLVLIGKRVIADMSARVLPFAIGRPLPPTPVVWAMLAVLGIVHTAIAGMLYLSGLRSVKAQDAGILAYLEPMSGAVYGMIFLGEPLTAWVAAGGLLILAAGSVVIRRSPPGPAGLSR